MSKYVLAGGVLSCTTPVSRILLMPNVSYELGAEEASYLLQRGVIAKVPDTEVVDDDLGNLSLTTTANGLKPNTSGEIGLPEVGLPTDTPTEADTEGLEELLSTEELPIVGTEPNTSKRGKK